MWVKRSQAAVAPVARSTAISPAARLRALLGELAVERQAVESLVVARARQADDGVAGDEGQPARIARAEADRLETAACRIDGAEFAGP